MILVFAPHPDDDTLACGGTIANNVLQGKKVKIIFMTDGRNSHLTVFGIQSNPSPEELAVIRKQEAIAAAKVLGVFESDLIFLGYKSKEVLTQLNRIIDKIKELIDFEEVEAIYFPHPFDKHPTHKAVNKIVMRLVRDLKPGTKKFQYILWKEKEYDVTKSETQIAIDISNVLEKKIEAIGKHRSQVEIISPQQGQPVLDKDFLDRFKTRVEVFYELI